MQRWSGLSSRVLIAASAVLACGSAASAATFPTGFDQTTIGGLSTPVNLAIAPDGRVFVSQQCGAIRIIKNGALVSSPFVTISGVSCSDERGLHGMAFDPNFATNGLLYVRYTRASPLNNVIARLQASATNPDQAAGQPTVLFTIPWNTGGSQRYHHGGGVQIGNDGKLYSSIGDHESGSGQSLNNLWGKVVRLNIPDGTIPTDNPFFNTTTGNNRAIYAYGFRNPFTMDIQPVTGRIHVNDVGNQKLGGREEVNHLTAGANYQWPNSQGGATSFFNYEAGTTSNGNAITGGDFYNPQVVRFPSTYVGKYFFGDYGGGWIRYINGSGTAGSLIAFGSGVSGPTDIEVHPDGTMWIVARNAGSVIRLSHGIVDPTPTPTPTNTPGPTPTPTATLPPNTPPQPVISAPPDTLLYKGGDIVSFAGDCTDAEDGTVPASGVAWDIVFHHNTHTHPGAQFSGVKGGSYQIPTVGEIDPDQWYRFYMTCTDSRGASVTVQREIFPKKQTLTLLTSPSGLQVDADGFGGASPQSMDAVVNVRRILNASAPQTLAGTTYYFARWSHGGAQRHEIMMPDAPTSYSAEFEPASAYSEITPAASAVTASTSDANVPGNTVDNDLATRWSGNGDNQWLRFDLGTPKTLSHVRVAAYQGNVRRNRFDIQISDDGSSWSTVFSGETSGTTTNEETFDFADASGRYVRYLGHGNIGSTNPTMNSVTEVSLFGFSGPTPTPTPTPITPTPTATPIVPTPTPRPTEDVPPPMVEITPPGSAVTASTSDTNVPANTVDNNLATRWSGNGDGAWLRFDLSSPQTVSFVRIAMYNGNARINTFDLQHSNDGNAWTDIQTGLQNTGTTTAEETFDFPDVTARYIRYVGHMSNVGTFNSVTEVSLWQSGGGPVPTLTPTPVPPTPTPTVTSTPTPTPGECVEITPSPCTGVCPMASTDDGNVPANAVDNNLATRWSGNGDGAWLRIDLGSAKLICSVSVAAYNGNTRRNFFDIQVSLDATSWTNLLVSAQTSGTTTQEESFDVPDTFARYVRYVGHMNSVNTFNSVTEISIFGNACPTCPTPTPGPPTPTPTATPTLPPGGPFALGSSAFADGALMPVRYTCAFDGVAGQDISPPLNWGPGTMNAQAYAIVFADRVNGGNKLHWMIWDIPPSRLSFAENLPAGFNVPNHAPAKQKAFTTGANTLQYFGPCPGGSTNPYTFTLYAQNVATIPGVTSSSTVATIETAIKANSQATTAVLNARSNASQ
jgi:glucose/arabinose dehydrogenase/phosphatidylethanolamine-binding protein (PEBP) family uncharacterized protein